MGMSCAPLRAVGTGRSSIDVLLKAAGFLELADEMRRLVRAARAVLRDDIDERTFDVLGHALGVATDVNVRTFSDAGPQVASRLAHAILDVEFLATVARPSKIEARQNALRLHPLEFILVEEVVFGALVPEEQPVLT